MTIDPRYLVPETALPFFPLGVPPVWLDGRGKVTTWSGLRSVAHLDLSAPPKRDGIPERLDALPWALAVLAKRVGWAGRIDAFCWGDDGSIWFTSDDGPDVVRFPIQIWPDTIGLSPADATRAAVAAALRNVAPKEAP